MGIRTDIINSKGSTLQNLLDERGLSMAAVARMAQVSVEVVRKLRDGKTLRRDKFFAVVNCLKITPQEILPAWDKITNGK